MHRPLPPYFSPVPPRVLAHRGLALDAPENTPLAFLHAMAAGVTHLETDVHATRDGVAVIAHDADLRRVAERPGRVDALSLDELQMIDLGSGQRFAPLVDVLDGLPDARFNIDVKSDAAIEPTAAAVRAARAVDRVLITSFSERRRARTVALLPGVATSASARQFVVALLAAKLGASAVVTRVLAEVDALQIPERALGMSTITPRTMRAYRRAGVQVHVWTVNEEADMRRLFAIGIDAIVTDRADLAVEVIDT